MNGCKYLEYPDKNKVHIYLCDDGKRKEIRELAHEMGVNYLDRKDNKGAKAGNLNNALKNSNSPLIVTLDADMIPMRKFLLRTVPYFVDFDIKNQNLAEKNKKKLGFVQTPQSFYNPDLFQFNLFSEGRIPNEQDYFYKDIQITRNKTNSVIYGGSNTILSREGIEEIGGFFMDAITEDFATGILLQKKGYICYATNEVLASGLSPTDLKSLVQQRVRWGRGVISTSRKMHIVLTSKLTLGQKMNYWASTWYWYAPLKRLVYFMSPILFAVFGYMVLKCTLLEVLIFWLPMYVSSNIALKQMSRNIRTVRWTSIYETVLFPFMLFPIALETFGITLKKFKITKKGGVESEKGKNIAYMVPFIILIVLSVIGIINCVVSMFETNSLGSIVVVFWLVNNLFILVMALFFVQGRTLYRKSERVLATVDCVIQSSNASFKCKTKDFSETGVSVITDRPYDIDDNEQVELTLKTVHYRARLKGKVVHVNQINGKWKYAFLITDMNDYYDEYLQILFDRVPTLPLNLSDSHSSFEDLNINVTKRTQQTFFENRKLARIPIKQSLETNLKDKIFVENYNFKHLVLKTPEMFSDIKIFTPNGLELVCRYERVINDQLKLFSVQNYELIHNDKLNQHLLDEWIISLQTRIDIETSVLVENKNQGGNTYRGTTEMDFL